MVTKPRCTAYHHWSTISASTIALLLSGAFTTTTALPSNQYNTHATSTTTTTTPPRGLSITDYASILSTDVEKIYNFNPNDPSSYEKVTEKWNKATMREWERATKVESSTMRSQIQKNRINGNQQLQQKERRLMRGGGDGGGKQQQTTTITTNTNINFPYVICHSTSHPSSSSVSSPHQKKPSGYHLTTTLSSHFNTNNTHFTPLVNDHDSKTCFMASLPASVAMTAVATVPALTDDIVIQPLLPEMKIAIDTIRRLIKKESLRLRVMYCPGVVVPNSNDDESLSSSEMTMVAEEKMASIISSIMNGVDDDDEMEGIITMMMESVVGETAAASSSSLSKDRFLQDEEENDGSKQNINNNSSSENNNNNSACHDIYQQIHLSSGYKGEYTILNLSSSPPSTTCILSLLSHLSTSPQICLIDAMPHFKLLNEPSQWILQSGEMEERPWFDVGLDGRGQVVAVSDTGVDLDNCYFYDGQGEEGVKKDGTLQINARKVIQYNDYANDYDEHGHGTHVCGTIAGRRSLDGIKEDTGMADGMAREAKLAMFDIGSGAGSLDIPFDIANLFTPGLTAGAHLHSASWGSPSSGAYDFSARDFDSWMEDHVDFLVMVAAGNSGHDEFEGYDVPFSVKSPATAKNVIAVGATESAGDECTGSEMEGFEYLAYFSSRGPTLDNRTKPDIVAPGYNILSAKAAQHSSHDHPKPPFCDESGGVKYMSGTSMATPAVSGMAALVRQYFEEGWYNNDTMTNSSAAATDDDDDTKAGGFQPSAALIKAILLNGAQYLKGINNRAANGSVTPVEPYDSNQGFGRLNLLQSLHLNGINDFSMFVIDADEEESVVNDGESVTYTAMVPEDGCSSLEEDDADAAISVTLVWTDPVGYPYCKKCLMNDLDLVVMTKNGTNRIYPNGGGGEMKDSLNNAERVQTNVTKGDVIEISVVAENLMMESQRFALVVTGCFKMV